ncbi:Transposon Tf2-6 polyprotein [Cucumispora dikerogammari]|nr:Transposon Tf2-6 polyprotein [Cucumispora dikerogammari]
MKAFLGLLASFFECIEKYSEKTNHLINSLRTKESKTWKWNDEMNKVFSVLKLEIVKLKKLRILDYNMPIVLRTDASNIGLRIVLMQEDQRKELQPLNWASKKLTPTEQRYGITEKEMLAVY